ncbi:glycosyltransferase family A protein [Flavobacterium sp.]|uniref:glycosyltransferase family 2 protein n=1 Tax=Flavobacterium sp. TaxID=239 RepID=UPI00286A6590|nr:glycosyltransferase family A protein [Flavobacterium sp.]
MKENFDTIYKETDIEILIATMNKDSLDFLVGMFPFSHFSEFSILIINQTTSETLLISDYPNIRVINSSEKGLSKSRNLALENAVKKILVIADDDVVYQNDFVSKIIAAYNKFQHATAINFCAINQNGTFLKKYPTDSKKQLNTFDVFNVGSIEMTINKERLDSIGIRFDENFGLGASFEMGEEAVFLFDLENKKQQISYENQILVKHNGLTTSDKKGMNERYYIHGAVLTRVLKKNYTYWLFLKLFFDLKQNKIKLSAIFKALNSAKKGRKIMESILNGK